jgi:hypothetical protein
MLRIFICDKLHQPRVISMLQETFVRSAPRLINNCGHCADHQLIRPPHSLRDRLMLP